MTTRREADDVYADVLNALMFIVMGGLIPAFLAWHLVSNLPEMLAGRFPMTLEQAGQGAGAVTFSLLILSGGVRMLRRVWSELRRI